MPLCSPGRGGDQYPVDLHQRGIILRPGELLFLHLAERRSRAGELTGIARHFAHLIVMVTAELVAPVALLKCAGGDVQVPNVEY